MSIKLSYQLKIIAELIPEFETKKETISSASVGWHLDHSLKVLNGILGVLERPPKPDKTSLKLAGRLFLLLGYIPRGLGTAPKVVHPPENILSLDLKKQLNLTKTSLDQLKGISDSATFNHPYFGTLSKKQSIRFMEVHTKHHLKIVKDILNK